MYEIKVYQIRFIRFFLFKRSNNLTSFHMIIKTFLYMISKRLFGISKLNQFNKALLKSILEISVMMIEMAFK
jgi:hypothetical protein